MIYPIYTSWGAVESEDDLSHVKSIMALSGSDGQVQSRIDTISDLSELWSSWGHRATGIIVGSGSSLILRDAISYNGVPVWNWLPVKEMLYTIEENTVVFSIAKR
jgi:hypothetical protein